MRCLVTTLVLLAGCTAPMRVMDAGVSPDTCVTDSTRVCAGPCNATQQCSGGAWGSCVPSCPAGTRCDGTACVNTDAGTSDAGTSDAGTSDAGTSDAGTSDAGTSDAGTSDAGTSDAGPGCDATSCPSGCCDGATCRTSSTTSCGQAGSACTTCDANRADSCVAGACRCGSSNLCAAGQSCVGGACTSGCGAGPSCSSGQRCLNSMCVCDATSCPNGCCESGACRVPSLAACGVGGATCASCDGARANRCEAGTCRCGTAATCSASQQCTSSGTATTTGVGFNDQQDRLVLPSAAWPTSTNSWTFSSWVRLAADRNTYSAFFTLEQPAGHSVEYNELITDADGTTLVLWDHRDQAAVTLGTMTVGTWYFAAISVGANGAATTWFGPAGGTLTRRTGTVAVVDHTEMSYLGASNFAATEFIDGSMAMARLWNGVLSDAEVTAEFASPSPVRTTGLLDDWRLSAAATVTADSSALAHTLTKDFGATHTTVTGPTLSTGAFTCSP